MYKKVRTKITNTRFEARVNENDETVSYRIYPKDGYLLHESSLDEQIYDDNGTETSVITNYTSSFITAGANYDFKSNPRGIYAIAIEEVDNI
ncbi:MAG: hypothetical protein IKB50_01635 [Clostridia bacterium]|nr:hypothetical protein [Clostridia bacterium]